MHTLWHEMSHGLGPGKLTIDGRETEVRLELKDLYSTLEEAKQALAAKADVIMLDNMDLEQIGQAVELIDKKALVEVSGGVKKKDLGTLAATGVDIISIGALTHAARCVDLSMRLKAAIKS